MVQLFLFGGGQFFTKVGVYGLGCFVRHIVPLVWFGGGLIFGKVGCFWFELVGVAHRLVGLVGWIIFGKSGGLWFDLFSGFGRGWTVFW